MNPITDTHAPEHYNKFIADILRSIDQVSEDGDDISLPANIRNVLDHYFPARKRELTQEEEKEIQEIKDNLDHAHRKGYSDTTSVTSIKRVEFLLSLIHRQQPDRKANMETLSKMIAQKLCYSIVPTKHYEEIKQLVLSCSQEVEGGV